MAVYTTGRTRTLTFDGTLSGPLYLEYTCVGAPFGVTVLTVSKKSLFGLSWMGWLTIGNDWTSGGTIPFDCTPSAATARHSLSMAILIGGGEVGDTPTCSSYTDHAYTRPGSVSSDISGTFTIEADVEECFEILALDSGLLDANGWPTYGGGSAEDGPPAYSIRYFERLLEGGQIAASCTTGGVSCSVNVEITSAMAAEVGYALDFSEISVPHSGSLTGSRVDVFGANATMNVGCDVAGYTLTGDYDRSQGACTCSADTGLTLYAEDPAYPSAVGAYSAAAVWQIHGPREGDLSIRTRSDIAAYAESQDYRWLKKYDGVTEIEEDVTASPDYSASVLQEAYNLRADLNGTTKDLIEVGEQGPCRIYLLDPSDTGDDADDWRCLWHTVPFVAMTLEHAASTGLDDGSDDTDWTGDGVTVSVVSGAINLEGTGGAGTAEVAFSPSEDSEAYRYLRLRVRSVGSAGESLTITIGSKTWDVVTGADGTWANHDLDLCCPHNASATSDDTYTRWPIDASDEPTTDGPLWGISRIATIGFATIGSGTVIEIDAISLERLSWALVSGLPGFEHHEDDHTVSPVQIYPHAYIDGDGRLTDPGWYMYDDGLGWTHASLAFVAGLLGAVQGITAVSNTATGDGWHNEDAPAAWLLGMGNYYRSSSWRDGLDVSIASQADIYAQGLYDQIEWYCGIGDPFEGAAYSPSSLSIPLRINKLIRAAAQGLGFSTGDVPQPGAKVQTYETATPANLTGDDTTGALGEYLTGTPYGKGAVGHTIEYQVGSAPTVAATWENRRRMRANFRASATEAGIAYDVGRSGIQYRARIFEGAAVTAWAAPTLLGGWNETNTGIEAYSLALRVEYTSSAQRIFLWVENSEGIEEYTSPDDGRTWSLSTAIADAGTTPAAAIMRDGLRYVYWIEGGDVLGRIFDAADSEINAEFTAISSVDDSGLACREYTLGEGKFQIGLFVYVSGVLTHYASDEGIVFA